MKLIKLPLSLLASSLALASLPLQALTQAELDNTAKTLNLTVQVVDNKPNDCPAKANNVCYRSEVQLTNNGTKAFDKNIDIYFSTPRLVIQSNDERFTITHINGDLNRISTTDKFTGLQPGEQISFQYDSHLWGINDTDFGVNYYLVAEGLEARVIANTVPLPVFGREDVSALTPGIPNIEKFKQPNDTDNTILATSATRFLENSTTQDLGAQATNSSILPTPDNMVVQEGSLNIASGIQIIADSASFPTTQQEALEQRFQQLGINTQGNVPLNVSIKDDKKAKSGSYTLEVNSEGISVQGADIAGAFYGVQSVISLITLGQDTIPNVSVEDSPRYDYRGMHLDVSRNFHNKAFIFKFLDQMAAYKLNKFHFHLADDEGWRLEIPGLPELTEVGANRCHDLTETVCLIPQLSSGPDTSTKGSGYYSLEDYKEILAYASARNIQVIPSMDMPGHSRAAIKSMDARYRKYMAQGDQVAAEMYLLVDPHDETQYYSVQNYTDNTINPCMESSFVFMDKVIDEIKKLHQAGGQPLTDYHIGADETAGAWSDSPVCRQLFVNPNNGINSTKDLNSYFIKRISHILSNHNLNLAAWSDGLNVEMAPESLAGNSSVYVWSNMFWGGAGDYDAFATAGHDVVVAMPDTFYFATPYEADPKERGYYWATRNTNSKKVFKFMPDNIAANAETMTDQRGNPLDVTSGKKGKPFKGIQGNVWGETMRQDAQVEYMTFPRALALAERAWHKADWELKHKAGVNYKTNEFNYTGTNHMGKRTQQRELDWQGFANTLGYKELAKMDMADIAYRLPTPGGIIEQGKLHANVTFPGLTIEYSLDGKTWLKYDNAQPPAAQSGILIRSIATNGRTGRSVIVE